ncbi:hypothetical protein BJX64DRAFT_294625 [Aspergillus heterothallicus]
MKIPPAVLSILLSLSPKALGQAQLVVYSNWGCLITGQCTSGSDAFYTSLTTDFCLTLQEQSAGVVQRNDDPKTAFCENDFSPGDGHTHRLLNCDTYTNESGDMIFSSADWYVDGEKYGHCGNQGWTYGDFTCQIAGWAGYVNERIATQCFPG